MAPQAEVLPAMSNDHHHRVGGFRYTPSSYLSNNPNNTSNIPTSTRSSSHSHNHSHGRRNTRNTSNNNNNNKNNNHNKQSSSAMARPWNCEGGEQEDELLLLQDGNPRGVTTTKRSTIEQNYDANRQRTARIQAKKAAYRKKLVYGDDDDLLEGDASMGMESTYQQHQQQQQQQQQQQAQARRQSQQAQLHQPQQTRQHISPPSKAAFNFHQGDTSDDASVMSHEYILEGRRVEGMDTSSGSKARAARQKRLHGLKGGSSININKENEANKPLAHNPTVQLRQVRARRVRNALKANDDEVDHLEALRERRQKEAERDRLLQLEREEMHKQQEAEQQRLAHLEQQRQAALHQERLKLEQQKRQLEQDQKMIQVAAAQKLAKEQQEMKELATKKLERSQQQQQQLQEQIPAKASKAPTTPRYPRKMTIQPASPAPVVATKMIEQNRRPRKVRTQLADKVGENMCSPAGIDDEEDLYAEQTILQEFQDMFKDYSIKDVFSIAKCGCNGNLDQVGEGYPNTQPGVSPNDEHDLKLTSTSGSSSSSSSH